ncbi:MAG: hypothetical protein H6737_29630 [Alphaproteobacteria bacterium]|nr:hypothetical protein [Alphaproteobacteria bacterium]
MLVLSLFLPASAADVLPVRRIRFYETGVAWYERDGIVKDATSLPVPTSHLDDALKTLVVLGGDVELGAISFPSALGDDAARIKAGLPENRMGFADALTALMGASVTLKTADGDLKGVLVDVSGPLELTRPTQTAAIDVLANEYALTVLAADGVIHRTTTDRVEAIRSDEPEVTDRLATAARTLARTRAQRPNALDVQLEKGGRLGLGYLAESAVWRVSYRVIDPEDGSADLQAWALIHNDTDEAWRDVSVELANGEPDSFLYPLAAPRYAERELVAPPVDLATVSQLTTATPDEMWNAASSGSYGMGMSGTGMGGGGSSYGYGGVGSVSATAAQLKTAEPVETPTQFVYRVTTPVDLPAHHSALVPLVQEGVPVEAAVVFEPGSSAARSGMWMKNGTDRTLPAGVVTVLQSGGLAGEARLERLKPDETQMVTFGNELDVDLDRTSARNPARPDELVFAKDRVTVREVVPTVHTFAVRNRSGRSRDLWLGLALSPSEEVQGELRTEIDPHSGWTWVVLPFDAGSTDQVVTSQTTSRRSFAPAEVAAATWRDWAERELADAGVLRNAAKIREAIDGIDAEIAGIAAERTRARTELDGLRASLTAAEGSDGTQPLTRRAATVESEVRKLDEREATLRETRDRKAAEITALLKPLADATADAG